MLKLCSIALLSVCLFAVSAQAQCSNGICQLPGRPVAKAVSAVRFVRDVKPVRSVIANIQPFKRVSNVASKIRPLRFIRGVRSAICGR